MNLKSSPVFAASRFGANWTFTPSVGVSRILYTQSDGPSLSENMLIGKLSAGRKLGNSFRLDANLFSTLKTLSISTQAFPPISFLGINFRVGSERPFFSRSWWIGLSAGLYYSTSRVSDDSYGYASVVGPQMLLTLKGIVLKNKGLNFYLKAAPIANRFSLLSFGSRELATGAATLFNGARGKSVSLGLDASQMNLGFDRSLIVVKTLGASLGFSF